jgi:hypothetical protein
MTNSTSKLNSLSKTARITRRSKSSWGYLILQNGSGCSTSKRRTRSTFKDKKRKRIRLSKLGMPNLATLCRLFGRWEHLKNSLPQKLKGTLPTIHFARQICRDNLKSSLMQRSRKESALTAELRNLNSTKLVLRASCIRSLWSTLGR